MAICDGRQVGLVIVGHVDNGKSTLIGRMFCDAGLMPEGKFAQLEAAARRRGAPFEFAHLMDALQAERDQNITIDTAQIWLSWGGRRYVIIDAPGHKEFLKNMITGAARADGAVVVLDAKRGVLEQARRHGLLLTLLGVEQIVVVVNKMDLADFSEARFNEVAGEYASFLGSIGVKPLAIIPAVARDGDHVVRRSARMHWASGPTVIESFKLFARGCDAVDQPIRFPVQDVYRFDSRRILAGRVEAGIVRAGDHLRFLPSGKQAVIASIERWPSGGDPFGRAGESIGITLSEELFLERGEVGCAPRDSAHCVTEFRARLFWLGERSLTIGRRYLLRLATQEVSCQVVAIDAVINASTLSDRPYREWVTADDVADVVMRTSQLLVCDRYSRVPRLGRFAIVDGSEIVGGGTVTSVINMRPAQVRPAAAKSILANGGVSPDERYHRNGHRGAVIWLTGLSGSGKSTIATALERKLFDRGINVFVLDGDNVRQGLTVDLGFSGADRSENIRRVAEVATLVAIAGIVVIVAFITPAQADRTRAREIVGRQARFTEVFVDASLETCERRDPKGLYAKARNGTICEFTGISAAYERPQSPDVTLLTDELTVAEAVTILENCLRPVIKNSRTPYRISHRLLMETAAQVDVNS